MEVVAIELVVALLMVALDIGLASLDRALISLVSSSDSLSDDDSMTIL
jgi:hypothetical protein